MKIAYILTAPSFCSLPDILDLEIVFPLEVVDFSLIISNLQQIKSNLWAEPL